MDRTTCEVKIGGEVSRSKPAKSDPSMTELEALMGAISSEDVSAEWGDSYAVPETEAELLECVEKGHIVLRDCECSDDMDGLTSFLMEEGIPFQRTSGMMDAYLGEDVYWLPGMKGVLFFQCDGQERHVCMLDDVRSALASLNRGGNIDAAKKKLKKLCPIVPKIPQFKIVD